MATVWYQARKILVQVVPFPGHYLPSPPNLSILADDIISQRNVELQTRIDLTDLILLAGQHYYFTVTAYNRAGLHTVTSSDGFIVDLDGPVAGVVYNTNRNRNLAVQSDTSTFDLTWHGFIDPESGVKGYYVALFEDSESDTIVHEFTYVDIKTTVTLTNLTLEHGKRYYGAIRAINTGELSSDNVVSKSKLIDTTPPTAYTCADLFQIYETNTFVSKLRSLNFQVDFKKDTMYLFTGSLDERDTNPMIKLQIEQSISVVLPLESSHDGRLSFSYHFKSTFEGLHNVMMTTVSPENLNLTVLLQECGISEKPSAEEGLVVTQLSPDTFKARLMVIDQESGIKSVSIFKFFFGIIQTSLIDYFFRVLDLVMLKQDLIETSVSW